ncbi:MAG: hypothetical protein DHS20C21_05180 [Gemmatimonadota bacterium]|nr:MAG: hypothetical protein DHS20C21_05180 [Gemmatimonadota bacterium]
MRTDDAWGVLDDAFEEAALAIGGLIVIHPVEDEVIQRLFASLTVIRERSLRRVEGVGKLPDASSSAPCGPGEPHPAVEAFLATLGRN